MLRLETRTYYSITINKRKKKEDIEMNGFYVLHFTFAVITRNGKFTYAYVLSFGKYHIIFSTF